MTAAVVRTRALTRRFGSHRGIRDVDLEVAPGEVFGFLGPNGAGKSTTIRILMGLIRPTSGEARVLGGHPQRDGVSIRARVGYLPGDLALHPRTTGRELLERFAHVRDLRDTRYRDELVERFGADLERPTQALSKGNRQKLGIVLAFMHRPDLLVLDEPTSGLDPLLQNEFAQLLEETAQQGRTVFLSSHDLDEVQRVADRIAIIREGQIVVTDTVDGLRSHSPRTIELQLEDGVDDAVRALSGVEGVKTEALGPHRLRLTVNGPVAPVLRAIAPLDPVDLTARPVDLDELFLGYYRNEPDTRREEASGVR